MDKEKYIHTGHLIDGSGNTIQKNIILTIKNDRIIAIDPFQKTLEKSITHNFFNNTLLPLLADAHVHLAMSGTRDVKYRQAQLSMNFDQAKSQMVHHLDQYSKAGILIVRDGGDHFGHVFKYKNLFKHSVSILSSKHAWYRTGRYGQFAGKSIHLSDNCLDSISSQHQGDHIKLIQSGINSVRQFGKETKPQFSQKEMSSICKWANQQNIPVMVHANGVQPVKIAIDAGCTSIEHGYFMGEENLKKMADKQIYWVPTLIPMYELAKNLKKTEEKNNAWHTFENQCEQVRKANDFGVPIVFGSDAGSFGVNHVQGLFDEMQLMIKYCGFSLSQVVQSCTSLSMSLFNRSHSGLIKKGALAQFAVFSSEPDTIVKKILADKSIRTFNLNNT